MSGDTIGTEAEVAAPTPAPGVGGSPAWPGSALLARLVTWAPKVGLPSANTAMSGDGGSLLQRGHKPVHVLLAIQLLLAGVIATTAGGLIVHLRDRALVDAEHELQRVSLLLAEQAERGFEAVELVQTAFLERVRYQEIETPAAFRERMSGTAVFEELRNRASSLPQLEAITVIDSDGNLVNFSRSWPVPQINVADRDYFQALKANSRETDFISTPVQNRSSGTWTIYFAHKVSGPDHTFLGLVLAAMPLKISSNFTTTSRPVPVTPSQCSGRMACFSHGIPTSTVRLGNRSVKPWPIRI